MPKLIHVGTLYLILFISQVFKKMLMNIYCIRFGWYVWKFILIQEMEYGSPFSIGILKQ